MKKYKGIIIGTVILGLLIVACIVVSRMTKDEEATTIVEPKEIVLIDETNDTVTTIAYSNSYGEVNFSNQLGTWVYSQDPSMPVSVSFIEEMVSKITKITASREIETHEHESEYGFDSPTLELTVGTRGGDVHSFVVGALNKGSGNYYVKFKDKIYMIDSTIVTATNYDLMAALDVRSFPVIDTTKITSITVNGEEANKDGYSSLSVGIAEDYKNAENYGFDGTENKVVVKYTETAPVTDNAGNVISEVSAEKEYTFSYVTTDDGHYIMLQDDPIIYRGLGIEALTVSE